MIRALLERLRQKHRTVGYPAAPPVLPDRFRGRPELAPEKCPDGCADCAAACPVGAITRQNGQVRIDMGRCLFCGGCAAACPHGALRFTRDHRLAARMREDLVAGEGEGKHAEALHARRESRVERS